MIYCSIATSLHRFFTYVNEAVLYQENFQLLQALQDNYIREQGTTEVVTDGERQEQSNFLDYFLATPIGLKLYDFLSSKSELSHICETNISFVLILNRITTSSAPEFKFGHYLTCRICFCTAVIILISLME